MTSLIDETIEVLDKAWYHVMNNNAPDPVEVGNAISSLIARWEVAKAELPEGLKGELEVFERLMNGTSSEEAVYTATLWAQEVSGKE